MTIEIRDAANSTVYDVRFTRMISWAAVLCFATVFIFVSLDLLLSFTTCIPVIELQKIFDITQESSVGTWFFAVLSFASALTLLPVYLIARAEHRPKQETAGWLILILFFVYMSMDECAWIHERSGDFLERMVDAEALPLGLSRMVVKFPTFYWQLIMGPIFVAMGLFMLYFLWQRFHIAALRKYIILSLIGLGMAMFIDFVEGMGRGIKRLQMLTDMSER